MQQQNSHPLIKVLSIKIECIDKKPGPDSNGGEQQGIKLAMLYESDPCLNLKLFLPPPTPPLTEFKAKNTGSVNVAS